MNLLDRFDRTLERSGQGLALTFAGQEFTLDQIEDRSNRLANRLAADGFEAGDRIAVYLSNCVELIEAYLAALKLGLIFVPINVLYRDREINHIVSDAEPKGAVTSGDLEVHLRPALATIKDVLLYRVEDLPGLTRDASRERPVFSAVGDTSVAIVYTSGTTGRSKGAVLTHGNFAFNAEALIEAWRVTPDDRLLLPLPLFHVHGLGNGLHTWLLSGYLLQLLERFRKETIAQELLDFRPTIFFGVPTMYERLLDVPPKTAREIGSTMRLFVSGSAPLPAATLDRFEKLYGHVVLERYGMSETMMNTSNPYDGERRPGSVGRPLPGVAIRVAGSDNKDSDGEIGEVLIKGPNVFPGYWRQPEATKAAFTSDGYFRSGDLAVRSPDGYYTLKGRKTELIISGGFNIYPREVEEFLNEQPEVLEAAVVGEPDTVRGWVPVAYIVPGEDQPLDGDELCSRCREHLASFKVPRRITVVAEIPRNALGKIQRHRLRNQKSEPEAP